VVEGVQQRPTLCIVVRRSLLTVGCGPAMQAGRMRGFVDLLQLGERDLGVDLRRGQLLVAERTRLTLITFLRY
jgi:hypothetical protein